MLAVPLNVNVLRTLEEGVGPTALPDLRRAIGHPPVTTMRSYLRRLVELGLIRRHREDDFPGSVSYVITPRGERLLAVGEVVQVWLRSAPEGEMEIGSTASKSAIKALVDGWSTGLVRALAARPLGLTELNRVIPQVSYPTLERRLTAMRQVGLIEPERQGNGRVTRCEVTDWLRHAVAPLTAGVGWECTCIPDQTPAPGRIDAEAAFLLAVPVLELPADVHGVCRLAVEFRRGSEIDFAGVTMRVSEGRVESCVSRIDGKPDAWATGGVLDWFRWMRELDGHRIDIGGDPSIANAVADAMRAGFLASSGK
ncbi:MAG TPA: winged helix-turn-helix transcriptional regulator [Solirubrobacterales bacterium]|nr:winged helix-turn-helix transcriptional regulator [Solirubrobacterales bacterium]